MNKRCAPFLGLLASVFLAGCSEGWGLDQHGKEVTADQLDGQWLLINYWAEWCAPCRLEIPELNALDASRSDITVLGVNFDALQGDELAKAAEKLEIRFRVLSEDPAERLELPRNAVLPVTYIVDGDGEVRERLVGEQTAEGLSAHLARLNGTD